MKKILLLITIWIVILTSASLHVIPLIVATSLQPVPTNDGNIANSDLSDAAKSLKANPASAKSLSDGQLVQVFNSINYLDQKILADRLDDADILRALRNDPGLMYGIGEVLTQRGIKNPKILNDNPDVKAMWFKTNNKIFDQGAVIGGISKDGEITILQSNGKQGVVLSRSINIFNGELTKEGKLIIPNPKSGNIVISDGATIVHASIDKSAGYLDGYLKISGGKFSIGDKIYSYTDEIMLDFNEDYVSQMQGVTFDGKNIIEKDSSGVVLSEFSGRIKSLDAETKILYMGSELTYYDGGKPSENYRVSDATILTSKEGNCNKGYYWCIEEIKSAGGKTKLHVRPVNAINTIIINPISDNINAISVDEITGPSSTVVFAGKDIKLKFKRGTPLLLEGSLKELNFDVYTEFIDDEGLLKQILIKEGKFVQCTANCISYGYIGSRFSPTPTYNTLKSRARESFGPDPILFIGYIDEPYIPHESQLLAKLTETAKKYNIDPEIFIATYFQEGGVRLAEYKNYGSVQEVDIYSELGIDSLFIDMKNLNLPPNYPKNPKNEHISTNEDQLKIIVGTLGINEAIIGMAALMQYKIDFATRSGTNKLYKQLSKEDQWWVQYAAYNWGQGNVRKLLDGDSFSWGSTTHKPMQSQKELEDFIHQYRGQYLPKPKKDRISNKLHFNAGRAVGGACLAAEAFFANEKRNCGVGSSSSVASLK